MIDDKLLGVFCEQGYLRLGRLLEDQDLSALRHRIDAIMMGSADVPYSQMPMQLDPSANPPARLSGVDNGHKLATLAYRKVQGLELDSLFFSYLSRPVFADLCRRVYGEGTAISCMRAMFMNKPAGGGTDLRWHQDRWTHLDRDPQITVWTALDPTTISNGCVEIVPRSHRQLRNSIDASGFLDSEQIHHLDQQIRSGDYGCETVHLELEEGEAVLLHNWTLHRSGTNATDTSRRAFSVCYMDAATRSLRGSSFSSVFGSQGRVL